MRQVLFTIPLDWLHAGWAIPINTYGMMLFFAFLGCSVLAKRMCRREGINPELIPDLIIWLFVSGIAGGRILFVVQYWKEAHFDERQLWHVVALWDGGLVLYGALFGGAFGYLAYHHFVLSKQGVSVWKMLDVIAPCVALGVAFGRLGCLGTGCCFGNVACETCPAIHFPLWNNATPASRTAAASKMVGKGYQTPLGFTFQGDSLQVQSVEPGSDAERAGLRRGDVLTAMECSVDSQQRSIPVAAQAVFFRIDQFNLTTRPPRVLLSLRIERSARPGWLFKGDTLEVEDVEPRSNAAKAGLVSGDVVSEIEVDGKTKKVASQEDLRGLEGPILLVVERLGAAITEADVGAKGESRKVPLFREDGARSSPAPLTLVVRRGAEIVQLPPFMPSSIGLHPTQIYETISMALLLFFLLSYYPYKRHDGELMVLFMFCYASHRFLNEMLRTDTDPVAFGLTLSQNVSILMGIAASVLAYAVWRRPIEVKASA